MTIALSILAQIVPYTTFYTQPDRKHPGNYITEVLTSMPARDPFLSPSDQLIEATRIGDPSLQTSGFSHTQGHYPVSMQVPPSEQQTMTYEQQVEINERRLNDISKQTANRASLLRQQLETQDQQYQMNVVDQSEKFTKAIAGLVPGHPDYEIKRAERIKEFPLAMQNGTVSSLLGRLDNTHAELKQNDVILNRGLTLKKEQERAQTIQQSRTIVAGYKNPALVAAYEKAITDENVDPLSVAMDLANQYETSDTIAQLRSLGITDLKKYRTPDVDQNGHETGTTHFNVRLAQAELKDFPTAASSARNIAAKQKIANKYECEPDMTKWSEEDQNDYNLLDNEIQRYRATRGDLPVKKTGNVTEVGGTGFTTDPVGTVGNKYKPKTVTKVLDLF